MSAPSRVAAGSTHDRQGFRSFCSRFTRISPLEEKLKQVAEELQRHVLERESGAVEELEDELVVAQLGQGRHVGMSEGGGVGSADDRA